MREITVLTSLSWKRFKDTNILISRSGRVFNMRTNRFVNTDASCGYKRFSYNKNGKSISVLTHRAVAELFIKNPENKEQVNHKNLNKKDNRVENLEWCTRRENLEHSWVNGRKKEAENHGNSLFTNEQVGEIKSLNGVITTGEIAEKFKAKESTIRAILSGQNWKSINV